MSIELRLFSWTWFTLREADRQEVRGLLARCDQLGFSAEEKAAVLEWREQLRREVRTELRRAPLVWGIKIPAAISAPGHARDARKE